MPEHHAVLSPSASKRWISCPASIRMQSIVSQPVENTTSPYAAEGTTAHTVAELSARFYVLRDLPESEFAELADAAMEGLEDDIQGDMLRHGSEYAELLQEKLAQHPMSRLLLEQRLPTGVPQCWGTSDAVIVSPTHVEVVDYKYGLGIWVGAEDNSQLMLYGVGALDTFGDVLGETENVRLTIHQPRLDNVSSWDISPDKLRQWRDDVVVVAEEALGENAHFGPSAEACRFCPAAGECRPRMEAATAEDFSSDPDLLEAEEIGDLLKRIPEIKKWCAAVEDTALRKAYSEGLTIPGWKVVKSGGNRRIDKQEEALQALYLAGYTDDQVLAARKLRGIGELERLLGKQPFQTILGSLAVKGPGSPSLAPESDKREALTPNNEAVKEFTDE